MESWDDLRLVGVIAEQGSMAAAARALSVDHSTVFRRLNAIEKELGVRLFDRSRKACVPTPAGERMVRAAAAAREALAQAQVEIEGQDARLSGRLRCTITPYMAQIILVPLVASFQREHPQIRVDLTETYSLANLMQREADIALRITSRPPESLIGHHLGSIQMAVYGSAQRYPAGAEVNLSDCNWVVQATQISTGPEARWIQKNANGGNVRLRAESGTCVEAGVAADIGVGVLPCFRADRLSSLRRLTAPMPEMQLELWALTHPHLRSVARVVTMLGYLREQIPALLHLDPDSHV